jgi:TPR repeat protein
VILYFVPEAQLLHYSDRLLERRHLADRGIDAGANVKQRIKAFLAGGVLALALFGSAMAGPLEDGEGAYHRGDYAEAMRLLRPLAEQGDANAQSHSAMACRMTPNKAQCGTARPPNRGTRMRKTNSA